MSEAAKAALAAIIAIHAKALESRGQDPAAIRAAVLAAVGAVQIRQGELAIYGPAVHEKGGDRWERVCSQIRCLQTVYRLVISNLDQIPASGLVNDLAFSLSSLCSEIWCFEMALKLTAQEVTMGHDL